MMTGKLEITITVWEERKIKNFLKKFPLWRGELVMVASTASTTVVPGFACLVGFVRRSHRERCGEL